jgi:hypothetical protein
MANAFSTPACLVRHIESVMSRKPVEREREHDLAGPLRPAVAFLSVFETLQLATNIDEHPGELRSHGFNRPHDTLLGGDDLIA